MERRESSSRCQEIPEEIVPMGVMAGERSIKVIKVMLNLNQHLQKRLRLTKTNRIRRAKVQTPIRNLSHIKIFQTVLSNLDLNLWMLINIIFRISGCFDDKMMMETIDGEPPCKHCQIFLDIDVKYFSGLPLTA